MTPLRQRMLEDMQLRGFRPPHSAPIFRPSNTSPTTSANPPTNSPRRNCASYFLYLRNDKRVSPSTSTDRLVRDQVPR